MKNVININESQTIKVTNKTIKYALIFEIGKYGDKADLNHIDVSEVTSMYDLFERSEFNGDISKWNTENVEKMNYMFKESKFNGDISNWNVENVTNMHETFHYSRFRGDISNWKPRSLTCYGNSFKGVSLKFIRPMWYQSLYLGLFKSGNDYCDSLRYDWLRGDIVVLGRLERAIKDFEGDLSKIKKIKGFTFQN